MTFDDNKKSQTIGIGNMSISPSIFIENLLLVNGLKYNLFSISQFCDKRFKIVFELFIYIISSLNDNGTMFIRYKYGNIYMVDQNDLPMKDG